VRATVPFRIGKKDVVHEGVKCLPTASSAAHTQGTGLRHLPFLERLVANIHLLSVSAEEQETAQRCILDKTIRPTGSGFGSLADIEPLMITKSNVDSTLGVITSKKNHGA
jgi:hypothetical protein